MLDHYRDNGVDFHVIVGGGVPTIGSVGIKYGVLDELSVSWVSGDKTVPNPTTSAILRACGCASRATLFRNDLAFAANPAVGKNPHTFLTNLSGAGIGYALAAQGQIATFFASDGATTVEPDGPGPFFETPTSMVPEDLAYIP